MNHCRRGRPHRLGLLNVNSAKKELVEIFLLGECDDILPPFGQVQQVLKDSAGL